jgi:threonyl-tRNA synthetase
MEKIPIVAIIGAEEEKQRTVTLRYLNGDQEKLFIDEALSKVDSLCRPPVI